MTKLNTYLRQMVRNGYANVDKGHDSDHVLRVWSICKKMLDAYPHLASAVDFDMLKVASLYHDIGLNFADTSSPELYNIDREAHHVVSAFILMQDQNLREFFSESQIKEMARWIKLHRSSLRHLLDPSNPKDLPACILNDADAADGVNHLRMMERALHYHKKNLGQSREEANEDAWRFFNRKFLYKEGDTYRGFILEEFREFFKEDLELRQKACTDKDFFMQEIQSIKIEDFN